MAGLTDDWRVTSAWGAIGPLLFLKAGPWPFILALAVLGALLLAGVRRRA